MYGSIRSSTSWEQENFILVFRHEANTARLMTTTPCIQLGLMAGSMICAQGLLSKRNRSRLKSWVDVSVSLAAVHDGLAVPGNQDLKHRLGRPSVAWSTNIMSLSGQQIKYVHVMSSKHEEAQPFYQIHLQNPT